ncbi:MAG: alpha/beta hydrolase [Patescibacteria group bacterium]
MQTVINGVLTNYELVNPKARTPVIILHGWGSNSSYWTPLAKLLSDKYRYYLLDLPGFGGTRELAASSDIPEYTQFVKNFAQKLKLENLILVGHSFGGQITGDYSIKFGNDLKKIILIDPAIIRVRSLKTMLKIGATKIIKPLISLFPTPIKNSILSLYAPPEYVQANKYLRSVLRKILKYDLSHKLHLIKTPTEVIWGSDDHVIPYMGKFLVENIPTANLHVVYPAGHLPHLTHTNKLAAILNQILSENEPA